MGSRGDLLREVMLSTGTTQSKLSQISGVHQPSISQFISGKVKMSDEQLDRLLSCMGFRLEVVRRPTTPNLTRSERRSWLLHRSLSEQMTRTQLNGWLPRIKHNLNRLRDGVTGQPHERNVERWSTLLSNRDINGLKRVMTGLDRGSIEIREVSPFGGLLSDGERRRILSEAA